MRPDLVTPAFDFVKKLTGVLGSPPHKHCHDRAVAEAPCPAFNLAGHACTAGVVEVVCRCLFDNLEYLSSILNELFTTLKVLDGNASLSIQNRTHETMRGRAGECVLFAKRCLEILEDVPLVLSPDASHAPTFEKFLNIHDELAKMVPECWRAKSATASSSADIIDVLNGCMNTIRDCQGALERDLLWHIEMTFRKSHASYFAAHLYPGLEKGERNVFEERLAERVYCLAKDSHLYKDNLPWPSLETQQGSAGEGDA